MAEADAYADALRMLARRELSVEGVRARLQDRGFSGEEIDAAVTRLLANGALDDGRVARVYARTAATLKGRGRLRVMRELVHLGIRNEVAAEAVGEIFGGLDERALILQAIQRKLRGRTAPEGPNAYARLYQFLMRQGFSPAGVASALQKLRTSRGVQEE